MRLGITLGILISTLEIIHGQDANRAYEPECAEKEIYVPYQNAKDAPNKYRVCLSEIGDSKEFTCPDYLNFNEITKSCTVSFNDESSTECTSEDDKFVDPKDKTCRKYFSCEADDDGKLALSDKSKNCPGFFSVLLRDCVPKAEYYCRDDGPDCNDPDFQNRSWVDKEDCGSYYECFGDVPVIRKCPDKMIFDAHSQACTHEVKDECKADDSASGSLVDLETMCKGNVGKFLPDPYYCKGYYYCVSELTPYWSTCDPDRYFANGVCTKTRPDSCTCEDEDWDKTGKDVVKVPNNSDKSKYYECRRSALPKEKECPPKTFFDPSREACA